MDTSHEERLNDVNADLNETGCDVHYAGYDVKYGQDSGFHSDKNKDSILNPGKYFHNGASILKCGDIMMT